MTTLYKFLLLILSIIGSNYSFCQLKVQNDGRIGMGSILTPPVNNKVSIYAANKEVPLSIYGNNLSEWSQVNKTIIDEANVMSNVVFRSDLGRDVFYVNGNGDIYYRYGWIPDMSHYSNIISSQKIDNPLSGLMKISGLVINGEETSGSNNVELSSFGLIGEEISLIFPELTKITNDGIRVINYQGFIPILIEAIKEQQKEIDLLQSLLKSENLILKSSPTTSQLSSIGTIKLYQNAPNPFKESTKISYTLPEKVHDAKIVIYNLNGTQIKSIPLTAKENAQITIKGDELNPGIYIYTLIADNEEIDSMRMIVTD